MVFGLWSNEASLQPNQASESCSTQVLFKDHHTRGPRNQMKQLNDDEILNGKVGRSRAK